VRKEHESSILRFLLLSKLRRIVMGIMHKGSHARGGALIHHRIISIEAMIEQA
jgi:hypothetical protein